MSKKKIYISGKITGIEEKARQLFAQAQEHLEAAGFTVINPMALPHLHDKEWHSFMREDIKALCDCDAIYLLNNWHNSLGARLEKQIAEVLGLHIYYQAPQASRVKRALCENGNHSYVGTTIQPGVGMIKCKYCGHQINIDQLPTVKAESFWWGGHADPPGYNGGYKADGFKS